MEINLIDLDLVAIRFRVILQQTKKIQPADVELFEEWRWLTSQYQACLKKEPTSYMYGVVSVFNSIFNQKRLVFGITRKKIAYLIRTDENWSPKRGLKNDNYNKILGYLIKNNFIEPVSYESKGGSTLRLYKLVHPDLIRMIVVDYESQLKESIDFAIKEIKLIKEEDKKSKSKPVKEKEKLDNNTNNDDESWCFN